MHDVLGGHGGQGLGRTLEAARVDEVFTPEELAGFLKVDLRWVEKQTQARRLPGMFKAGRYWRYRRAEVEKQLLSGQVVLPRKKA